MCALLPHTYREFFYNLSQKAFAGVISTVLSTVYVYRLCPTPIYLGPYSVQKPLDNSRTKSPEVSMLIHIVDYA